MTPYSCLARCPAQRGKVNLLGDLILGGFEQAYPGGGRFDQSRDDIRVLLGREQVDELDELVELVRGPDGLCLCQKLRFVQGSSLVLLRRQRLH
ncbi:MAG: hypothetical protein ACJAZO_000970 [Myxococcota bacterium]